MKVCGRCHEVYYCSRSCQKAHWKQHRQECVGNGDQAWHPMRAITKDSIPTEWLPGPCRDGVPPGPYRDGVPAWVHLRAAALRVSPSHVHWHVAISVPDLPCVRKYMQWHDTQDAADAVPLLHQHVCDYRRAYGSDAVAKTIRSLQEYGFPWSAWTGVVCPMEIDIQVSRLSGTTWKFSKCKVSHTVEWLQTEVVKRMNQPNVRWCSTADVQLVVASTVLRSHETLSVAGLTDCAEVMVVVNDATLTVDEYDFVRAAEYAHAAAWQALAVRLMSDELNDGHQSDDLLDVED